METVAMINNGDGVVVHCATGSVYEAGPGEVINVLTEDAGELSSHPDWTLYDSEDDSVLEGE